ncbi:MAG: Rieske 2Fe-2S domain-containing protein [Cypionkella sp.]
MTLRWTASGLSHDLPTGTVTRGECEGQDLAIWRSSTGRIAAWKDRCSHRGMRLSHGFVREETLNCIYHGWVYGTSGVCSRIPAHPDLVPPAAIRAQAYDCCEADGVIWVATAKQTSAPPALPGLRPLRSLTVQTPELAVPGLSGADILQGSVPIGKDLVRLALILQRLADGRTTIHALCQPDAPKVAVSRWLEDIRRRAEAKEAV